MAKNSGKKDKNKKHSAKKTSYKHMPSSLYSGSSIDSSIKLTDYLAYMPGLLMVGMIALTLILSIMSPQMQSTQYEDFKNIFRVFDYVTIACGLIFLVTAAVQKRLKFCLRDYFFGGFMLCIVISTCINGFSHDAAFGIPARYIGILNMLAFFIIYMKVSGYIERITFRYTVLTGFLAVADAVAMSTIYEQYFGDIPAYQGKTGVAAIFGNSNHYGYYLAMVIVISLGYYVYEGRKRAIFGVLTAVLNLFVLMLNNTLGAILAVGICTATMVMIVLTSEMKSNYTIEPHMDAGNKPCKADATQSDDAKSKKSMNETAKRVLILAIIGVVVVVSAIAISASVRNSISELFHDMSSILAGSATGTEGSGRWNVWQTVARYIGEKPLFGHGCEGITMRLMEETGIGDAHCEPLTYAAYYGIPAALLYLAGVISAAVKYFKDRKNLPAYCRIAFLGASAYFISSLVGVPIFNTAPFFFIFMGMAEEEWREE